MMKIETIEKLRAMFKEWLEYFESWTADDGGLTMAAVDAIWFLHRMVNHPEEAKELQGSSTYWKLEPWEQSIIDEIVDIVYREN